MPRILIAYFSASGVSKQVAKYLAESCRGTLYEIKPKIPYTKLDDNYVFADSKAIQVMSDLASLIIIHE